MKKAKLSERQKDVLILLGVVLTAGIFLYISSYQMKDFLPERFAKPFVYIWYVGILYIAVISYMESHNKQPFVTGKTQSLGVVNSFTSAFAIIVIAADGVKGWLVWSAATFVMMFTARELGRVSRRKKEQAYLNQVGILLTDLHNSGEAAVNGQSVRVWSEKDIPKNSKVRIVELKGPYLYVEHM